MSRRAALALAATGALAIAGALIAVAADRGPSTCAELYAETGDEQYRGASAWTCHWAELRRTVENVKGHRTLAVASAAERTAQQEQQAQTARTKAEQEARLMDELRVPVCATLADRRHAVEVLAVDLVGLSGHASIFSIDAVCRDCPDQSGVYFDATGERFCTVGGKGGRSCVEAKPFPHTAKIYREGTADALWGQFGCR